MLSVTFHSNSLSHDSTSVSHKIVALASNNLILHQIYSGVFVRLGTLLAERLLYSPSVGYCMLLSLSVYWAAQQVCFMLGAVWGNLSGTVGGNTGSTVPTGSTVEGGRRTPLKGSNGGTLGQGTSRFQVVLSKCLYWVVIAGITSVYTRLTVSRSLLNFTSFRFCFFRDTDLSLYLCTYLLTNLCNCLFWCY